MKKSSKFKVKSITSKNNLPLDGMESLEIQEEINLTFTQSFKINLSLTQEDIK